MADLIISQPMTFTVDVKNGLVERPQRESLMRGDKMANRIIAELVYGSEPFDITGVTVKGKFCRPPSGDEIDLAGEAKGNVAEVQLTDQCYTSGGHYEARVILVLGGVERTVLFISGDVLKSGSGNAASDEETGGSGGSTGSGLPAGGTAGQVLVKVSSAQGDAIWKTLTAADVGALPSDGTAVNANALNGKSADQYALKTDLPTKASDVGALAEGAQAADSAKLGGKAPEYYLQPWNLLDNSDFRNPVNQRGQTTYTSGYTIDRWTLQSEETAILTVDGDGITVKGNGQTGYLFHRILATPDMAGKILTAAVCLKDGTIHTFGNGVLSAVDVSGNIQIGERADTDNGVNLALFIKNGEILIQIKIPDGVLFEAKWAALYEGSYTADNLPPYVPKGYSAELVACRRYYRHDEFLNCVKTMGSFYSISKNIDMRIPPNVECLSFSPYGSDNIADMTGCTLSMQKVCDGVIQITYAELPTCSAHNAGGLAVKLNADL